MKGGPYPRTQPRCVVSHEGVTLITSFKIDILPTCIWPPISTQFTTFWPNIRVCLLLRE